MMYRLVVCLFGWVAVVPGFAFGAELPAFQEVYDVLRTNLLGLSPAEFEQQAGRALLLHFAGQVVLPGETAPPSAPAVAHRTTFDQFYPYLRVGQVDAALPKALAESLADTNWLSTARGFVLDLRFAQGSDYAAAARTASRFVPPDRPLLDWGEGLMKSLAEGGSEWTLPIVVLVNHRTIGAAEALAAILREAGAALVIGAQTAGQVGRFKEFTLSNGQIIRLAVSPVLGGSGAPVAPKGVVPDITVATREEHELAWLNDPFTAVAAATNSLAGTNRIVSSVTVRRRVTEADLVRAQKVGKDPAEGGVAPSAPSPSPTPTTSPSVRDPILGRALDLLKGLSLIRRR